MGLVVVTNYDLIPRTQGAGTVEASGIRICGTSRLNTFAICDHVTRASKEAPLEVPTRSGECPCGIHRAEGEYTVGNDDQSSELNLSFSLHDWVSKQL